MILHLCLGILDSNNNQGGEYEICGVAAHYRHGHPWGAHAFFKKIIIFPRPGEQGKACLSGIRF